MLASVHFICYNMIELETFPETFPTNISEIFNTVTPCNYLKCVFPLYNEMKLLPHRQEFLLFLQ